jgi:NADH-quinone oxidoreductase subunit F
MELVLTKYFHIDGYRHIDTYVEHGGYAGLKKALQMKPDEVIEEVKKANLRGRGGAGFPAGVKWGFVPKESDRPKYLVVNADEGEPGTFKDRLIMEKGSHMLMEGIAIASYAISANISYIYIRGEFIRQAQILEEAIAEAYERGYLGKNILGSGFDIDVYVHRGAGSYICGEETALIESLEGKKGQPRLKPPFPAQVGVFAGPTIVNNVETIADVPYIIVNGGEKFASLGVEKDGGTRLFGVSGFVKKPGIYELPVGTNLIIVIPEGVCMVKALLILAEFYAHESCGQCTPCREGTEWLRKILHRMENGQGRVGDLELILELCDNMMGKTICPLAEAAGMPAVSFINKFREEFEYHIQEGTCLDKEIRI